MPWLDTLVEDAQWRRTIYDLLDKHPRCEFLNVAVMVSIMQDEWH